jgi:hypothetical protein
MKQSETVAFVVGDGAATIHECSNTEREKIPELQIVIPLRLGRDDVPTEPAHSMYLYRDAVKNLYEGLKKYYEEAAQERIEVKG